MPNKRTLAHLDDARRLYEEGHSLRKISKATGLTRQTVTVNLKALGIEIVRPGSVRDLSSVVDRYRSGETSKEIAASLGINPSTVTRALRRAGAIRSSTEAQLLLNRKLSPEERQARVAAAHHAVRGTRRSEDQLIRGALTRERAGKHGSEQERLLAELCASRGLHLRPQVAVGRYSVDLAAHPVAVEVASTSRLIRGEARARNLRKFDHLLNSGWHVVLVWTIWNTDSATRQPVSIEAADYLVAFLEFARRNPAAPREYRVIWSAGKEIAIHRGDFHNLPFVPPGVRPATARRLDNS